MKKIKEKIEEKISERLRRVALLLMGLVFLVPTYTFAAANYGQNFGNYTLDQLFWVGVVIIVVALIGNMAKRNVVGIVITLIIGVIVLGVMKDPTGLQSVGTSLWNTIKG